MVTLAPLDLYNMVTLNKGGSGGWGRGKELVRGFGAGICGLWEPRGLLGEGL